ncbi:GGDEF domain-containing protein [Chlorobium sp.]|jgi:diguanylate cyclase (GGDEF)-like protein|uniref:GGDEF domain-containing protein n=1 Tax=Chlorobium sp. TaxID=1095 RepID=UPI003C564864|nr:GGDEF domain-containing protein [Chlorobiaceae bacterium]NTW93325.1 GGDEF domain-containing protein [Chlorobiaceae bacterium]
MSSEIPLNQPVHLKRITLGAALFLLLLGLVIGGFMLYRNMLVEDMQHKQALYRNLVELKGKVAGFEKNRELSSRDDDATIKVMQFMLDEVLESAAIAGKPDIPGVLIRKRNDRGYFSAANREVFLLALDNSTRKADKELQGALDASVWVSNVFVMTLSLLVAGFVIAAWRRFYIIYTMTLIPLSRLSGKVSLINKNIPESIHDTADDIRNDLALTPHSWEISRITDTMVDFCRDIEAKNKKLDELYIRDEKTNLYNYRHFKEHLIMEIERSKRLDDKVSIAMIDIDHFKHYNDENGHVAGDQVLEQLAGIIGTTCRTSDMPSRFGGEEFAVLFPRTGIDTSMQISDRLRMIISAEPVAHEKKQPGGRLTVSIGIATFPDDAQDWYTLVNNADRALYHAKSAGRNNVCAFSAIKSGDEGK